MATTPRLFVSDALAADTRLGLSAEQAHYLRTVLRRGVGDPVLLFNGRDGEWDAVIATLDRGQSQVDLLRQIRAQADEPGPWLAFAPLKRDATDLVIRMATELGVAAIQPVLTERTVTARVNLDRLRLIAIEAAEQSERLTVPTIHPPLDLAALLDGWPRDRRLFAAIERSDSNAAPGTTVPIADSGLLVGPEGGFSRAELDALAASPIVSPISLGRLVLRAETACVAGLALIGLGAFGPSLLRGTSTG